MEEGHLLDAPFPNSPSMGATPGEESPLLFPLHGIHCLYHPEPGEGVKKLSPLIPVETHRRRRMTYPPEDTDALAGLQQPRRICSDPFTPKSQSTTRERRKRKGRRGWGGCKKQQIPSLLIYAHTPRKGSRAVTTGGARGACLHPLHLGSCMHELARACTSLHEHARACTSMQGLARAYTDSARESGAQRRAEVATDLLQGAGEEVDEREAEDQSEHPPLPQEPAPHQSRQVHHIGAERGRPGARATWPLWAARSSLRHRFLQLLPAGSARGPHVASCLFAIGRRGAMAFSYWLKFRKGRAISLEGRDPSPSSRMFFRRYPTWSRKRSGVTWVPASPCDWLRGMRRMAQGC